MIKRAIQIGLGVAAVLAMAAGIVWTQVSSRSDIGGPFRLVDHTGRQVTDGTYRGKALLVFFGYRFCPDICPTDLQVIARTLDLLGPDAERVQALFVSVDPERDTPPVLAEYVTLFHPDIVGLTGTPEQVADAAAAYRVYYAKVRDAESGADYLMDHSAFTYLMGPDGGFVSTLPHAARPEAVAEAVRAVLAPS